VSGILTCTFEIDDDDDTVMVNVSVSPVYNDDCVVDTDTPRFVVTPTLNDALALTAVVTVDVVTAPTLSTAPSVAVLATLATNVISSCWLAARLDSDAQETIDEPVVVRVGDVDVMGTYVNTTLLNVQEPVRDTGLPYTENRTSGLGFCIPATGIVAITLVCVNDIAARSHDTIDVHKLVIGLR